jgi:hypothetical protein
MRRIKPAPKPRHTDAISTGEVVKLEVGMLSE